jgi:hypothetical protein
MNSRIGSLESIPGLLKGLQIRAQATLASGIGSLESIPGLSLSPYLETFKGPKNWFQGTRDACNNRHIERSKAIIFPVVDSPHQWVGESPNLRIRESGSRQLPVLVSWGVADSLYRLLSDLQ